ncbi:pectinesterase family protein [uncultured Formosa sp.]|uniref:pectinesterase family protein n=1 Tax=uncultured Formosa sp. TaxID=255435 RepID=UPI003457A431
MSTFFLGIPWNIYEQTVFVNCFIDQLIKKEGWHNWNKPNDEHTSFYAEFNSSGPGASGK